MCIVYCLKVSCQFNVIELTLHVLSIIYQMSEPKCSVEVPQWTMMCCVCVSVFCCSSSSQRGKCQQSAHHSFHSARHASDAWQYFIFQWWAKLTWIAVYNTFPTNIRRRSKVQTKPNLLVDTIDTNRYIKCENCERTCHLFVGSNILQHWQTSSNFAYMSALH